MTKKIRGKRATVWLLVTLPIALFLSLWQKALWRPHLVVAPLGGNSTAPPEELGRLLDFSNHYAFFFGSILYDDMEFDDLGHEKALQPQPFNILAFGGELRSAKIYSPLLWANASFISDSKVVLWSESQEDELSAQLFDCETLQVLRKLNGTLVKNDASDNIMVGGKGFISKRGVVFVTKEKAFEWSLETSGLLHQWNFHNPHEEYPTAMSYSRAMDAFIQIGWTCIRVWDAKTGKILRETKKTPEGFIPDGGDESGASNVAFSHNGDLIAYDSHCPNCDT